MLRFAARSFHHGIVSDHSAGSVGFIHDEAMLAVGLESDSVSSRTATPISSPRLQPEYENQWSAFVSVAHNGAMWLHNDVTEEWFFVSCPPKEWTRYRCQYVADDGRTSTYYWWWHDDYKWFYEPCGWFFQ